VLFPEIHAVTFVSWLFQKDMVYLDLSEQKLTRGKTITVVTVSFVAQQLCQHKISYSFEL
jgi:hypothetical protein